MMNLQYLVRTPFIPCFNCPTTPTSLTERAWRTVRATSSIRCTSLPFVLLMFKPAGKISSWLECECASSVQGEYLMG